MPRRIPIRPAKLIGNFFVLFVLLVIAMIYYSCTFLIWLPKITKNGKFEGCDDLR